jgi:hypothetical protein
MVDRACGLLRDNRAALGDDGNLGATLWNLDLSRLATRLRSQMIRSPVRTNCASPSASSLSCRPGCRFPAFGVRIGARRAPTAQHRRVVCRRAGIPRRVNFRPWVRPRRKAPGQTRSRNGADESSGCITAIPSWHAAEQIPTAVTASPCTPAGSCDHAAVTGPGLRHAEGRLLSNCLGIVPGPQRGVQGARRTNRHDARSCWVCRLSRCAAAPTSDRTSAGGLGPSSPLRHRGA